MVDIESAGHWHKGLEFVAVVWLGLGNNSISVKVMEKMWNVNKVNMLCPLLQIIFAFQNI